VAVLHDGYRLDVGCGDRLRHAGKRDPRARLFVQEYDEGVPLPGAVVRGRWHPLKRGHPLGDGSSEVTLGDGGVDTSHGDD
jgi:hypothetical protein